MNSYNVMGRASPDTFAAAEAVLAEAPNGWDGKVSKELASLAADRLGGNWDTAGVLALTESVAFYHDDANGSLTDVQKLERRIVLCAIQELLGAGYSISVWNGGDLPEIHKSTDLAVIQKELFAADMDVITAHKEGRAPSMLQFVYGNSGYDVLADYSTRLEHEIESTLALIDSLEKQNQS